MAGVSIMTENKEYEANWENTTTPETNYKKQFIPEDSYNGVTKVVDIVEVPDFKDRAKKIEKLALVIALDAGGKEIELTHFLRPMISKGSTNKLGVVYSNSKLYDLLIDLGLREKFKQEVGQKFTAQKVKEFLTKELSGKTLRVSVKTSKANTPEQYSTIAKVLRFA